jgi:hypothetical protein
MKRKEKEKEREWWKRKFSSCPENRKKTKEKEREMAIENILQLPQLGYVDREQFSALASGPHKIPGRLYPTVEIGFHTLYILTVILHSSLWRRERDRHASRFYWLLYAHHEKLIKSAGVACSQVLAPSTLSHAHLRPHFGFTKTVFFAISFSIRRLIVHRYVQFCFSFFSFGFF